MPIVFSFSLFISNFAFANDAGQDNTYVSSIFSEPVLEIIFAELSFVDKISFGRVVSYLRKQFIKRIDRKEFELKLTNEALASHSQLFDRLYGLGDCPFKFYSLTVIGRSDLEIKAFVAELFKESLRIYFDKLDVTAGSLSHRHSPCKISPFLDIVFSPKDHQIKHLKITSQENLIMDPFVTLESLEIDGKWVSSAGLSMLATSTLLTILKIQIEEGVVVDALPKNLVVLQILGKGLGSDLFQSIGDLANLKSLTIHSFSSDIRPPTDISLFIKSIIDHNIDLIKITGVFIVDDSTDEFLENKNIGGMFFRKYIDNGPRVDFSLNKKALP